LIGVKRIKMRKVFEITNKNIINDVIQKAEYGTLALCMDNKPYSIPINFVEIDGEVFFHGAKKGKKIEVIKNNSNASFSVVEDYSLLPSYFSTDTGTACPATQLYKSVILDGQIQFVEDYEEKVNALETLMKKLQKEGKYIPLNHEMYKKAITAVCIYKLVPTTISAKFGLGQHFNKERYERVIRHLEERGTKKDLETLSLIKEFYKK